MSPEVYRSGIGHLAIALGAQKVLAVLSTGPTVYADDSGKHLDPKLVCIGGLFAGLPSWAALESEWEKALQAVPGFSGQAPAFHMTDFEVGNWPTKQHSWPSEPAKRQFLHKLLTIICKHVEMRMYAAVSLGDYRSMVKKRDLTKKSQRRQQRKAAARICYGLNSYGCILATYRWTEAKRITEDVLYVFESGTEGSGFIQQCHKEEIEKTGIAKRYRVKDFGFGSKKTPALQASDIWAYEIRQHFENSNPQKMRASLRRILRGVKDGRGFVFNRKNIKTGSIEDHPFTLKKWPTRDISQKFSGPDK